MQPSAVPTTVGVGVGPRAIAIIIDAVALGAVSFIVQLAAGGDGGAGTLVGCLFAIASLAYYPVMEKMYGASLGKMAMGLKVVTESGQPLDWGAAIIRTLLRIIDGLFFYLVGAILVWTSPTKQRLGDKVAKTFVVRKDQVVGPSTSPTARF
ncbi:MAG TPA: RDD family protein [Thermomicrobiales bacterium]|nr:RDD family protein [Thermomicrobiales bacterium]